MSSSQMLIATALDHIRHGVMIYDYDLVVVAFNQRAREILKVPLEQFSVGEPFENLVRINAENGGYGGVGAVDIRVAERMAKARTFELFHQDQRLFYGSQMEVFGVPIPGVGYVVTYTDTAATKLAENSAKAAEHRLHMSQAFARIGTWEQGLNSLEWVFSESVSTMFSGEIAEAGVASEEVWRFLHPEDLAIVERARRACIDGDIPYDAEFRVVRADGTVRWLRQSGDVERDSNGTPIRTMGIVRDVSIRWENEEALRRAKAAAETANKAKSLFLSSMSHELRTPMNAILGFAQLLRIDPLEKLSDRQSASLGLISTAGQNLLKLIDGILDLVKIETGNLDVSIEDVSVSEIINDCLARIDAVAKERQISIVSDVPATPEIKVRADSARLRQSLLNLVSNAVKYNRPNGSVTIGVTGTDAESLRLSVTDTGNGITPEKQGDLFEPFKRLGAELSQVEGTGIGLTITKRTVELMGGEVGLESEVGKGSRFWIDLPQVPGGGGATPRPRRHLERRAPSKTRQQSASCSISRIIRPIC